MDYFCFLVFAYFIKCKILSSFFCIFLGGKKTIFFQISAAVFYIYKNKDIRFEMARGLVNDGRIVLVGSLWREVVDGCNYFTCIELFETVGYVACWKHHFYYHTGFALKERLVTNETVNDLCLSWVYIGKFTEKVPCHGCVLAFFALIWLVEPVYLHRWWIKWQLDSRNAGFLIRTKVRCS